MVQVFVFTVIGVTQGAYFQIIQQMSKQYQTPGFPSRYVWCLHMFVKCWGDSVFFIVFTMNILVSSNLVAAIPSLIMCNASEFKEILKSL